MVLVAHIHISKQVKLEVVGNHIFCELNYTLVKMILLVFNKTCLLVRLGKYLNSSI